MTQLRTAARHRIALAALFALGAPLLSAAAVAADYGDQSAYVMFSPDSQSVTMSGSGDDVRRARAQRAGREGLLYIRQGGDAYVVRDADTLRRARAIFAPQQALGARQSELGAQQSALGARQSELGSRQAGLGARQANATPREQQELGRQQEELGRQQNALGEQQNALGERQSALGEQQNRLAQAARGKIHALVADAVRSGVARRVD